MAAHLRGEAKETGRKNSRTRSRTLAISSLAQHLVQARGTEMDDETAFPDLKDFEFFQIILGICPGKLRLPGKFAKVLDGREPREVKLREVGGGRSMWDVEVVFDGDGHMYLGRSWEQFACAHGLRLGDFLVFNYDGDSVLTVKVFDVSMCRRHYQHADDDAEIVCLWPRSGSSSSGSGDDEDSSGTAEMADDVAPSMFTATLRECNLGMKQDQYLNVPLEFQTAHGYAARKKLVLRMRGESWTVNLKNKGLRAWFRYGWHQFCVDNGLGVGDTCFFRVLREGDARRGEDHVLKVEVRKRDGTFDE